MIKAYLYFEEPAIDIRLNWKHTVELMFSQQNSKFDEDLHIYLKQIPNIGEKVSLYGQNIRSDFKVLKIYHHINIDRKSHTIDLFLEALPFHDWDSLPKAWTLNKEEI